jgi:hypothetical protein
MPKKTVIHVNQHIIKSNAKNGETAPVLTVKDYQQNRKAHEALIYSADGEVVARVVYADGVHRQPLACGARVWIETVHPVETIDHASADADQYEEVA